MTSKGLRIVEVEAGSIGAHAGLATGDEILTINGKTIPDELALRFHLAEEQVEIEVRKQSGQKELLDLDLEDKGSLGLGIRVDDFKTRTCNNACLFCFIDQLPPAVRPTLQVKDDDYRLSFLHGNYITLTNLPERELDRIIEQALSPLYISVHATDPALRTRVLGRRRPDDLDRKMRKLIAGGIRLHTQIVLMPGINDGSNLAQTVSDLHGYHPGVHSVAIVPLGLSDHGAPKTHYKAIDAEYCRKTIDQVAPWQQRFQRSMGRTFVYLADEFYIQGRVPLPDTSYYDEFAQLEDGIGMVRNFIDEFERELKRWRRGRPELNGTLTTAKLFGPYLLDCIGRFNDRLHSRLRVVEIENTFMGKGITVAGLLSGRDIVRSLRTEVLGDFVVIPHSAVSKVDGILVDNMSPRQLTEYLGKPVYSSGASTGKFFDLLCRQLSRG